MRLGTRLEEFAEQCPVCFTASDDVRVYGCCGYCVCADCYERNPQSPSVFCRAPVPQQLRRADVGATADAPPSDAPNEVMVPTRPVFDAGRTFAADLASWTSPVFSHLTNATNALHCLVHHGFRRTLLLVETCSTTGSERLAPSVEAAIAARAGVRFIAVAMEAVRGAASLAAARDAFARAQRDFGDDPAPLVLVSYGMIDSFLVGIDLPTTDSILAVGAVPERVLMQALGRAMRPNELRDNERAIPMVRIRA